MWASQQRVLLIDAVHNIFRIGLRFKLDSDEDSITRQPMYNTKMPTESIVILSKLFFRSRRKS